MVTRIFLQNREYEKFLQGTLLQWKKWQKVLLKKFLPYLPYVLNNITYHQVFHIAPNLGSHFASKYHSWILGKVLQGIHYQYWTDVLSFRQYFLQNLNSEQILNYLTHKKVQCFTVLGAVWIKDELKKNKKFWKIFLKLRLQIILKIKI